MIETDGRVARSQTPFLFQNSIVKRNTSGYSEQHKLGVLSPCSLSIQPSGSECSFLFHGHLAFQLE